MIRMTTDQLAASPTRFANLTAFLANTPSTRPVLRRPERAEPVPQRRDRRRSTPSRSTTSASRRTNGALRPNFTLNYGLRYDYYAPLQRSRQPDRQVQHRHRRARSRTRRRSTSRRRTTSSRACRLTYSPTARRCSRPASASSSARARPKIRFSRSRAERISTTLSAARSRIPVDPAAIRANFIEQPEQPVVSAARLRERLHASREGLSVHGVGAAGAGRQHGGVGRLRRQPGPQPVPAQHREPDHRRAVRTARRGDAGPRVRSIVTARRDAGGQHLPARRRIGRTPKSTTRPAAATTATTRCSCR